MRSKVLQISAVVAIFIITLLLIGLVLEIIDMEQLKTTLGKSLLILGILAVATFLITAISKVNQD